MNKRNLSEQHYSENNIQSNVYEGSTFNSSKYCTEAISPVTRTLLLICINLLFTLIKEIPTSRIAYNYTHIHIFTNCSCNCFCLRVHLYCTILYCHPFYLSREVQLSCMLVSFTCPSPLCFLPLSSLLSL